jgi:DNA-binding beta-propeller fold protein YncE
MKLPAIAAFAAFAILAPAQVPHPALLVLNKEGSLATVDPATKKIVGTVRTGESPHEVAVSADGKLAMATNYGSQTGGTSLSLVDLIAQKEQRIDLGPLRRPHGVTFSGGKFYFTAEANQVIASFDPAANRVDWILGTGQNGTHMVELSSDQRQIYTANIASDSINIIDATGVGNWNNTVVPVGKGPEGFDITPDAKQLWAANSRGGSVSIVDIATKRVVSTFGVQTKRSNRLKFSPDGRLVLISDLDAGDLLILEHATKKELKRIKLGRQPAGILITPDSSRAFVAVTGDDYVAVIDLKTLELADRLKTGRGPDGMAWVP